MMRDFSKVVVDREIKHALRDDEEMVSELKVTEEEKRKCIPSKERELTGGLTMVMTATPSDPTSMCVCPLLLPIVL